MHAFLQLPQDIVALDVVLADSSEEAVQQTCEQPSWRSQTSSRSGSLPASEMSETILEAQKRAVLGAGKERVLVWGTSLTTSIGTPGMLRHLLTK